MTATEAAKQRNELAQAILQINEQTAPIFDAADGIKADMERRGWSPTAAERVALTWLLGAMGHVWTVQK